MKVRKLPMIAIVAIVGVVATGLAACSSSSSNSSSSASGKVTISGSGSTAVKNLLDACIPDYQKATGTTVNYAGGGSGAGRAAFTAGTVDFAWSDAAYGTTESQPADFVHVPNVAFPVAIEYKLAGFKGTLNLGRTTAAKIFAGQIKMWNDPAIVADNNNAVLPATPITVWYRSDKSGTTGIVTNWLTVVAPSIWNKPGSQGNQTFTSAFPGDIPAGTFQGASGSDGVSNGIASKDGSIGYSEVSYATDRHLGVASVQNGAGEYVAPTSAGAAAFLNDLTAGDKGTVTLNPLTTASGAYPISSFSYGLAYTGGSGKDAAKQAAVKDFFTYVLTTCATNHALDKGYVPVIGKLAEIAKQNIDQIH
ncbi:MAG TPA: phosphate ABC transporter substrate-binding protein PstS [Candidatus Nanopelagicaceae bacterium]|nr:phosphate ABC transporter substrate-binding protein PstS [Candidatus Nanopelagicaceae bacterium]